MGATRQNVQRIINDLHAEGLVAFEANPHYRRAQLVILTDEGKQTFDAAMRLQAPWVNSLTEGLSVKDIQAVHRVVDVLRGKLESNGAKDGT
jgi:DNA-binding MarR family transcriptional regulator